MKKRNPLLVFIFSIITLDIYSLYWLYSTKTVLNQKNTKKVPSLWWIIGSLIIDMVSFVIIRRSSMGTTMSSSTGGYSSSNNVGFIIETIIYIILVIVYIIWFLKYAKAANEYTSGKISTSLAFILMFLLFPLGAAVVQNAYNKTLESGGDPVNANQANPPQQPMPNPENSSNPDSDSDQAMDNTQQAMSSSENDDQNDNSQQ